MKFVCFFLLFFISFISFGVSSREWREYQSDNFIIYSNEKKPEDIINLARDFEMYRRAALLYFGLSDLKENEFTKIYVFDGKLDYKLLDISKHTAGLYRNTFDGPMMIVAPQADLADAKLVLFHEYVHYLLRERSNLHYPRWYEEGVADLLGAAVISDGTVSIGNINPWRRRQSAGDRRIAVKDLVEPPERTLYKYYAYFYPSSWIFTHFLSFSSLRGYKDYSLEFKRYLAAYQKGRTDLASFEEIMGISAKELDKKVGNYSKNKTTIGFNIPVENYEKPVIPRTLGDNEEIYLMSDLLLEFDELYKARHLLRKTKGGDRFSGINYALYAVTEAEKGDFNSANQLMAKAKAILGEDQRVLLEGIHLNKVKLDRLKKDGRWSDEQYKAAILNTKAVIAELNNNSQARLYLADMYRLGGQNKQALKELMSVYQDFHRDLNLNLYLAQYLIDINSAKLAKPFLQKIVNFTHSNKNREKALKLMEKHGLL